jgi:hypothetical protein
MRRPISRYSTSLSVSLILATTLTGYAQNPAQPSRGPDSGSHTTVPGIDALPYPGIPFSGIDNIVWTRTAADGTTTTVSITAKIARNAQGKLYRERHHFAPAGVDPAKTMYEFIILDPVDHSRATCHVASHECYIIFYEPQSADHLRPVGPFDNNRRYLTRDSLGTQTMNGLTVTGTKETTTIAPGTIGNEREVSSTREFWYAPDLKTNLAVTRMDPRDGTQVIHLDVQSRSDPDPAVFAIPQGYTIKDERSAVVVSR